MCVVEDTLCNVILVALFLFFCLCLFLLPLVDGVSW